jgi:hypothetical protein
LLASVADIRRRAQEPADLLLKVRTKPGAPVLITELAGPFAALASTKMFRGTSYPVPAVIKALSVTAALLEL